MRNNQKVNKKKTFEKRQFIKWYKDSIEGFRNYHTPLYVMIIFVIFDLFYREVVDPSTLVDIFKELIEEEGKSVEYILPLAYCYLSIAVHKIGWFMAVGNNRVRLEIIWPKEEAKTAMKYLKKAKRRDNKRVVDACLAVCLGMLKGYPSVNRYLKKIDLKNIDSAEKVLVQENMKFAESVSHLRSIYDHKSKGEYDTALRIMKKFEKKDIEYIDQAGDDRFKTSFYLLFFELHRANQEFESSLHYLEKCMKIVPNRPSLYKLVGWENIMLARYESAQKIFTEALNLHKRRNESCIECQIGLEFSMGMSAWRKWSEEGEDLKEVYHHFTVCSQLAKRITKNEFLKSFTILPDLARVDDQIRNLSQSQDLDDLGIRVAQLLEYTEKLGLEYGLLEDKTLKEIPGIISVPFLFYIKRFYLEYLLFSLAEDGFEGYFTIQPEGRKVSRLDLYDQILEGYKKVLKEWGFKKTANAFDYLKTFRARMGNRSITDIPEQESTILAKSLNQYWDELDGRISLGGILLQIQKEMSTIKKRINGVDEKIERIVMKESAIGPKMSEPVEITFFTECVRISTQEDPLLKQSLERYVLEYLVLHDRIHYLHGFVVFKERGVKFSPSRFAADPIQTCRKLIANLRGVLQNIIDENTKEPYVMIEGPEDGFYRLVKKADFRSNIEEAKSLYNEAKMLFDKEKYTEAAAKLSTEEGALNKYSNYMDAYLLLARCYIRKGLQKSDSAKLGRVTEILEKWESWHRAAAGEVNCYLQEGEGERLGNEEQILRDMMSKQREISDTLEQLRQYPIPKSDEDIKWEKFNRIQDIVDKDRYKDPAVIIEELQTHSELFVILQDLLSEVVKKQSRFLGAIDERTRERAEKDIREEALHSLIDQLRQQRYERSHFKSYMDFIKYFRYRIARVFEPQRTPEEKKAETLRHYLIDFNKIIRENNAENAPRSKQLGILKKHGWSKRKFMRVINYLEMEKRSVYLEEETDKGEGIA